MDEKGDLISALDDDAVSSTWQNHSNESDPFIRDGLLHCID